MTTTKTWSEWRRDIAKLVDDAVRSVDYELRSAHLDATAAEIESAISRAVEAEREAIVALVEDAARKDEGAVLRCDSMVEDVPALADLADEHRAAAKAARHIADAIRSRPTRRGEGGES